MGNLCPETPKIGAREEWRKNNVRASSPGALVQEIEVGRQ